MKNIRLSTTFLGLTFFTYFVNPTGWDSIGFSFPFWIGYIAIRMYEKNKQGCLLRFDKDTAKQCGALIAWALLNIISVLLHIEDNGALKLGFYYTLGAAIVLCLLDARLNRAELYFLVKMYTVVSVLSAMLMLIQQTTVRTYNNRFTIVISSVPKDPNYLAAYVLLPCVFCLYYFIFDKKNALRYGVLSGVVVLQILFTGSRAAFVALLGTSLFLFWSALSKKRTALKVVAVAALALLLVFVFFPDAILSRFIDFETYNDGSNQQRYDVWMAAVNIWLQHFWFGAGQNVVYNYGVNYGAAKQMMTHSTYFDILAEFGIIGLSLFMATPCYMGVRAIKTKRPLVLAILIATFFVSAIISAQYLQYFWLNIALCGVLLQHEKDTTENVFIKEV